MTPSLMIQWELDCWCRNQKWKKKQVAMFLGFVIGCIFPFSFQLQQSSFHWIIIGVLTLSTPILVSLWLRLHYSNLTTLAMTPSWTLSWTLSLVKTRVTLALPFICLFFTDIYKLGRLGYLGTRVTNPSWALELCQASLQFLKLCIQLWWPFFIKSLFCSLNTVNHWISVRGAYFKFRSRSGAFSWGGCPISLKGKRTWWW